MDTIEESGSVRLLGRSSTGSSESRWVDGSEVDWDDEVRPPPWSKHGGGDGREGYGTTIRRRLTKKPNRVDSFDVEAMEIAGSHGHHTKVRLWDRQGSNS